MRVNDYGAIVNETLQNSPFIIDIGSSSRSSAVHNELGRGQFQTFITINNVSHINHKKGKIVVKFYYLGNLKCPLLYCSQLTVQWVIGGNFSIRFKIVKP